MPVGVQQRARPIEPGAKRRARTKQRGDEQAEVPSRPLAEPDAERRDRDLAAEQIQRRRRRRWPDPTSASASDRAVLEDRQREDVERRRRSRAPGRSTPNGIAVPPARTCRQVEAANDAAIRPPRRPRGPCRASRPARAPAAHRQAFGVVNLLGTHRQDARRELDVRDQPGQRRRPGSTPPSTALQASGGGEDLPVADLAEPPASR